MHAVYLAAYEATPPEARPEAPRDDPRPQIGANGYVRLDLALAALYVAELSPAARRTYDARVRFATARMAGESANPPPRVMATSPAIILSEAAAIESTVRTAMRGTSTRAAVAKVMRIMAGRSTDACRELLDTIAAELLRLDVVHALVEKKRVATSPVARTIVRDSEGDTIVRWLAELDDGRYGLLHKVDKRWVWLEGDRATVLEAAPEHVRAAATGRSPKRVRVEPVAKSKPATHEARRIALELAVVDQGRSRDAFSVLADFLLEADDPHGELIRAQIAAEDEPAEKRRFKNAVLRLLRQLVVDEVWTEAIIRDFVWQRGYIDRVDVRYPDDVRMLANLPMPFARLLREVRFGSEASNWSEGLAVLQRYQQIESIVLGVMESGDLAPLHDLPRLRALAASYTRLDVIATRLAGLHELRARQTRFDTRDLAAFEALRVLDLGETALSDLAVIAACPLTTLIVDRTPISELAPLRGHRTLQHLDLYDTRIETLAPLTELPALDHIDIRCTAVSDLAPLASCPRLRSIQMLRCTQVADLTPLLRCRALEKLGLEQTHHTDLSALAGLGVKELSAGSSKLADLDVIRTMPNLRRVSVIGSLVPVEQIQQLRSDLPHVQIVR